MRSAYAVLGEGGRVGAEDEAGGGGGEGCKTRDREVLVVDVGVFEEETLGLRTRGGAS